MGEMSSADSIQVVRELEAVRKRPGMFIGGVDAYGLRNLIWEAVGNIIDLHLRRDATELHVDVSTDSWVTVRDDGPGIPVSILPETNRSFLETVFSTIHYGGTFDDHFPHVHVTPRLTGAGLAVVNALSSRLEVETTRDGVRWAQSYERGVAVSKVRRLGATSIEGTLVRFHPDPDIFKTVKLDLVPVVKRLQQLAWLNPLLRVFFQERRLQGRGGLRGWAEQLAAPHGTVARYAVCQSTERVSVDLALAWTAARQAPQIQCFVNMGKTTSGTHVDGIWAGLAEIARSMGSSRHDVDDVKKALGRGLVAVIHVGLYAPTFRNPVKEHLTSPIAGTAVAKILANDLPAVLSHDAQLRRLIRRRLGIPGDARG